VYSIGHIEVFNIWFIPQEIPVLKASQLEPFPSRAAVDQSGKTGRTPDSGGRQPNAWGGARGAHQPTVTPPVGSEANVSSAKRAGDTASVSADRVKPDGGVGAKTSPQDTKKTVNDSSGSQSSEGSKDQGQKLSSSRGGSRSQNSVNNFDSTSVNVRSTASAVVPASKQGTVATKGVFDGGAEPQRPSPTKNVETRSGLNPSPLYGKSDESSAWGSPSVSTQLGGDRKTLTTAGNKSVSPGTVLPEVVAAAFEGGSSSVGAVVAQPVLEVLEDHWFYLDPQEQMQGWLVDLSSFNKQICV